MNVYFLNELNTYAKKNSEKNNIYIYTILNWRTHVEGNNETGTTPTQRATKQTDDAYWQSFFTSHMTDQQFKTKTKTNSLSQLTCGLSDMEHYFYELKELNRSLNVHYQGRIIQRGGGQGGGVCLKFDVCPKNENGYQIEAKL